jgi:regulatory protein
LQQKQVNEYCIKKALEQMDEEEYGTGLKKLADEKYTALKNEQYFIRKKKTMDYLIQKGYEPESINTVVNMFSEKKK